MVEDAKLQSARAAMHRINQAWLEGRIDELGTMVHPEVVMAFPGFGGQVQGREDFLAGFRDFCRNARIHEFRELDHQVSVAGDTAVATFRYDMLYERSGKRYHSTGRDLWVFQNQRGEWLAVWRTMLDIEENVA